ncbi:MAG: hypothetical protein CMJ84_14460 [Planctomycetes bacterium]|nr:hypothetical protein [Planctomycetota bacterium]
MQRLDHQNILRLSVLLAGLAGLQTTSTAQVTERASVDSAYREGEQGALDGGVLSSDGRHVAFASRSTNLVDGDTNAKADVFVRDRLLAVTVRVSISSDGVEGNADSGQSALVDISADGRWVVFNSPATNLVSGDNNGWSDVFIHDRDPDSNGVFDEGNGTTVLVSRASSGHSGNDRSGEGGIAISGNGDKVAFQTDASDLTPTHGGWPYSGQLLVWDRITGAMTNVSIGFSDGSPSTDADDGLYNPDLSDDGSLVTFDTEASNLLDNTDPTTDSDTNGKWDVYRADTSPGSALTRVRASLGHLGQLGAGGDSGRLSGDGSQVLFESYGQSVTPGTSSGRTNVYVRDISAGVTTRLSAHSDGSEGNDDSYLGRISSTGRFVSFITEATDLFDGDTSSSPYRDLVLVDRDPDGDGVLDPLNAALSLGSVTHTGDQFVGYVGGGDLSSDGRVASFETNSHTVVAHDENGAYDVFIRDLDSSCEQPAAYCSPTANSTGAASYMDLGGSTSVTANDLALQAFDLPTSQFGIFFYGPAAASVPFGDGIRCVGSGGGIGLFRLSVVNSGPSGEVIQALDMTDPPQSSGQIIAGSTWNAQFWYRDPSGGPVGFNFSNALRISFCE